MSFFCATGRPFQLVTRASHVPGPNNCRFHRPTMTAKALKGFHLARIVQRQTLSPTVVQLELEVSPTLASFWAGQWVDFVVPSHEWVGGFSIASLPHDLPRLVLAVKRSRAAPSQWVHQDDAVVGTDVQIRVGGSCTMPPPQPSLNNKTDSSNETCTSTSAISRVPRSVVFCAGGIGVSPLLGMYQYWTKAITQQQQEYRQGKGSFTNEESSTKALFYYSAATEEELVFQKELIEFTQLNQSYNTQLHLSLTQQSQWNNLQDEEILPPTDGTGVVHRTVGRQLDSFLSSNNSSLKDDQSHFFICGPPTMIDETAAFLEQKQVDPKRIHYEKWW